MKPQIVLEDWRGWHNTHESVKKVEEDFAYKNLSTIWIIPSRGSIPAKAVQSWMNIIPPMNQRMVRVFVLGAEIGAAYEDAVNLILTSPELADYDWQYILTVEEDNMPPPDGLVKLYKGMDEYDVVGGLYWGKGEEGRPMIYGNPAEMPKNFAPQVPLPDQIQPCNGLGMGFTLFKLSIFKDTRWERPFFKTVSEWRNGHYAMSTQDLYFFEKAAKLGYRFACHTGVRVGHLDPISGVIW